MLGAALTVALTSLCAAPPSLADVPAEQLLADAKAAAQGLGTYRLRFTKDERVDGEMTGPITMELLVRQRPLAVRGEVLRGGAKGRRFLYDAAQRERELFVREAGLLGLAGGVWLDVDNRLTRRDTRHPVTRLGYGFLLDQLEADHKKAAPAGGHTRVDEGLDAKGAWCVTFTAPREVKGLYARKARLCIDPVRRLPRSAQIWDEQGVLERLEYELVARDLKLDPAAFATDSL